jgi:small-conductance mechanosensitive channel
MALFVRRQRLPLVVVPGTRASEPLKEAIFGTLSLNHRSSRTHQAEFVMNGIIYLVGLVVVIMAVLSFFGMH